MPRNEILRHGGGLFKNSSGFLVSPAKLRAPQTAWKLARGQSIQVAPFASVRFFCSARHAIQVLEHVPWREGRETAISPA